MTSPPAASIDVQQSGGLAVARVHGRLTLHTTPPLWPRADEIGRAAARIDVSGVPECDTAGASLLVHIQRRSKESGKGGEIVGAGAQVAEILRLVEGAATKPISRVAPPHEPADDWLFETIGRRAAKVLANVRSVMVYVGDVTVAFTRAFTQPWSVRWKDAFLYMTRAGADALPIVALINVLMGVILAFQGVTLLGKLGFSSYTPDAVAVSVVLELGPLMTAIIVAGRSGSAFAAEIGTMTVNEEVDALDTMGLDRTRFLVVPKMIALLAMMPLLVVFADACGLFGGLLISTTTLDMTVAQYVRQALSRVDLWGFTQGLIKGEAYALCIATVGCLRGLQTRHGAQGVGLAATSAVVTSIFLIVVADAVLTVMFHYVG